MSPKPSNYSIYSIRRRTVIYNPCWLQTRLRLLILYFQAQWRSSSASLQFPFDPALSFLIWISKGFSVLSPYSLALIWFGALQSISAPDVRFTPTRIPQTYWKFPFCICGAVFQVLFIFLVAECPIFIVYFYFHFYFYLYMRVSLRFPISIPVVNRNDLA